MWSLYILPFCIISFMVGLPGLNNIMTVVIVCRPQHASEPHGDQSANRAEQIVFFTSRIYLETYSVM